jgi:hypothetical protein
MAELATPSAARFPLRVKELLEQGLKLRDRYRETKSRCTVCGRRLDG